MKRHIVSLLMVAALLSISCKKSQTDYPNILETKNGIDDLAGKKAFLPDSRKENIAKTKKSPLTSVALSRSTHDFGKIQKGKTVEHVYEIKNMGKNPLIISTIKPSCGCTVPKYTKEPIPPGKTGKISLSFDSSNFEGKIRKQAEVYANVVHLPIILSFTGEVVNQ
ncbi:MAG: DUF1573 domain-containing protein [Bergeyella sp.]|nr:DUF1573 domain-containing protein [Bergeyella sp.]